MSMPRPIVRATLLAVAIVAVSACGSATPSASGGSPAAGATANPVATGGSQPTPGAPLPGANNPPIADGAFTSGKLHVEISGDVNMTLDAPLQGGVSFTAAGSTVLTFADPATGSGGAVAISPEGNVVTISGPAISTAASSVVASGVGCTITVTTSDAARLAGNFDCKRLPGLVPSTSKQVTVDLRGTFEAAR